MSTPVRVLLVSESEEDASVVQQALRSGGFDPALKRVDSVVAASAALAEESWDIVLPQYPGRDLTWLAPAVASAIHHGAERAEARHAEEVHPASEAQIAPLFDSAADAIVAADQELRVVLLNRAAERLFGYRRDEVRGQPLETMLPARYPEADGRVTDLFSQSSEAARLIGKRWEVFAQRKDGSRFPAEITISELAQQGGATFTCLLRDITDRKQTEERIQRQVRHLSALRAVDVAISSSFDRRVTLSVLLDQVTTQLQADAAAVLLLDPSVQTLEYIACRGFSSDALLRVRLRLNEGAAGRAAWKRRLVHVSDLNPGDGESSQLLVGEGFVASCATPLIVKGRVRGVLEVLRRTFVDPDEEWLNLLDAFAQQAAIAIDIAGLFDELEHANSELALAYDRTLEGWAKALELRDVETQGHCSRVPAMTVRLARAAGMSEAELVHVRRGALLHDIGKMGIPDAILLKPGPLTKREMAIMKRHPVYGYDMLRSIDYLRPALDIPYCHHEKWDGTGYPRKLKGEKIPLAARLFTLADVWDALLSDRPYRPAWAEDEVREYIRSMAGSYFDPEAVDLFRRTELNEAQS